MISIQMLRETPFIQSLESDEREEGLEEGLEKGREGMIGMLLHAIGKRFPTHDFSSEIKHVRDIDASKQLFYDLDRISDEENLRQRIAAIAKGEH